MHIFDHEKIDKLFIMFIFEPNNKMTDNKESERVFERLPQSLKEQILIECDESKKIYRELKQSIANKSLTELIAIIPKIVSNVTLINYLLRNDKMFHKLYEKFYPDCNEIQFAKLWLESFSEKERVLD